MQLNNIITAIEVIGTENEIRCFSEQVLPELDNIFTYKLIISEPAYITTINLYPVIRETDLNNAVAILQIRVDRLSLSLQV